MNKLNQNTSLGREESKQTKHLFTGHSPPFSLEISLCWYKTDRVHLDCTAIRPKGRESRRGQEIAKVLLA